MIDERKKKELKYETTFIGVKSSKVMEFKKIENGALEDIAPTILKLMQIKQPKEMTGKSLIK